MNIQASEYYSAEAITPVNFGDRERYYIARREALENRLFTAESGRQHSGLILNRDYLESAHEVIIADGQFLGSTLLPEDKYKGVVLALTNPGTPILLRDFGGHGNSSRHDWGQLKEAVLHRTLHGDADDLADITVQTVRNVKSQSVLGISLAGLYMPRYIDSSMKKGVSTALMMGVEAVGTDKKTPPQLMIDFFIRETKLQSTYKGEDARHNKGLNEAYEERFKSDLEETREIEGFPESAYKLYSIYKHDPSIVAAMLLRSPLATNQLFKAIEETMGKQPDMQGVFCLAGLSKVNRIQKIRSGYERLEHFFPTRFKALELPSDSHGIGLAPQIWRIAAMFADARA
jgi:hypothetical protein